MLFLLIISVFALVVNPPPVVVPGCTGDAAQFSPIDFPTITLPDRYICQVTLWTGWDYVYYTDDGQQNGWQVAGLDTDTVSVQQVDAFTSDMRIGWVYSVDRRDIFIPLLVR